MAPSNMMITRTIINLHPFPITPSLIQCDFSQSFVFVHPFGMMSYYSSYSCSLICMCQIKLIMQTFDDQTMLIHFLQGKIGCLHLIHNFCNSKWAIINTKQNLKIIYINKAQVSMQFSFKRPQTSKSVSAFYRDKQKQSSLPKATQPIYPSQIDDANDQNKKWKQAAQKINRQMVIHRALHANSEPFRLLSKIGGQVYSSQPKLARVETPPNKTRIRISSKEKRSRDNTRQVFPVKQSGEQTGRLFHAPIGQSKLKRKRRGENFRMGLQQQLKTTNIFYQSPVVKIGYNMQFEAYLRFQHISQIRPDHGGSICRNSMIFFLKDAPFSPNIISEKNTEVPIALSLFPQFFDSKLSISNIKRQKYFQKMLDWMNSTYDPQRMAALPHFSDYLSFDHLKYNEIMESLITSNQQNYKSEWAENIVKRLRIKLTERQLRQALAQQWEFFNKANAMITLDYVLKNAEMANKLKVTPYLQTRVITAKKILYHGGYCKTLYTSWSTYVDNSRKRLVGRLKNYTSITQSIYGWYCNFEQIKLYQSDFSILLQESLSVELFFKIQMAKIEFSTNVLQQIWFRGILCLYHYSRYLTTREGEYEQLGNYRSLLAKYIRQARSRSHEMKSGQQIEVFYLNFYQNFLSSLRKDSHVHDLQDLMPAMKGQIPLLSNIKVLLQIQFSKTIQKSFLSLRNQIVNYQRPLLRIHLVIDRQSFKFLEQEDEIINAFAQMIKQILGVKISGYAIACKFESDAEQQLVEKTTHNNNFNHQLKERSAVRQYPEIYQTGQRNSLEEDRQLNIAYKTEFIFDEQIRQIISCMKAYYKECFSVLGEYEMYLPFIKLTTNQKIFNDDQGSIEQSFLKNLRVVSRYKESINQLQRLVRINIFEVDCTAPIRSLEERVREIQYIIQQNYINIVHEKIEIVDSELNSLKIAAHNVGLTAIDIEQTEEKLIAIRQNLKLLHVKTKKIAEMVMFCLDNRRKVETVVTCYCQLISKKQDLHKEIDNLFATLESKRPQVEAESEQQVEHLFKSIDQNLQHASEIETTCFEFVNLVQYIDSLTALIASFNQLNTQIQKHFEHSRIKSRLPIEEKISLFRREFERFQMMIEYWKQFFTFESYFKEIAKLQARKIDFLQFSQQTKSSEEVIQRLQKTQQEWWAKDKMGWKPIIHRMHEYYSKKFKTDVDTCSQLKQLLQILTNRKVRDRHWLLYQLEQFRNISFRQLARLDTSKEHSKLQKMDEDVNFQYEIFLAYEEIEKKIKGHRLLIVDLNDSDVLDLNNLNKCVQFLRNVEIDIKELMQKDVGDYYQGELKELLTLSQNTVVKLEEWRSIEQKYIRFIRFHMINDEYEHSLFSALIELHRKLIKSYDIDNSVAFISKNIVMDSYLSQINDELRQLQTRVTKFLASLRAQYPRLFLLADDELFDFMSSGADIQKYLRKCFPQILNFCLREGSIERVGDKRELIFAEPYYIQQMIGRVNNWVSSLEDLIKCRLKQFFKTNQIITEGKSTIDLQTNFYQKYPPQLAILDEQIIFTEQISQAVATGSLRALLTQIQSKIQYLIKEKKDVFKLLLFLLFREQIGCLIHEEDLHSGSFQWLKYPRFYRKSQLDIRVAFIHQENIYGFNYLQKSQLIYTDSVFMGNCLVGPSGSGKTAFTRYLAYLCGQQLLIFDPRSIDYFQESISALVNFFRVNAFVGNWLLLQRIDLLGQSQLRLIAECLSTVQDSLKQQSNKLTLSGQTTALNKNCRVLMSVSSLTGTELPGRLCGMIRPLWMALPNRRFLLQLYLQSKRVNNIEVGKILKLCSWLENHRQISLQVLNWIRDQEDSDLFSSASFFQKASSFGIFQGEAQALLETLRSQDYKLNEISDRNRFVSLHEEMVLNSRIVVFGERSCGKTWEVLNNLSEGKYLLINGHHYCRNQQLFQLVHAIRNLHGYSHLVFKHGLQFYPLMRQNLSSFKVIFVQQNLAELQLGVVFDLRMVNYAHLTQSNLVEGTVQQIVGKVLRGQFSEQLKAFSKGTLFSKCMERLGDAASEKASINQLFVNFAKIFKIMLSQEYEFNVAFLFSVIWSFAFSIEEKRIEEIVKQIFTGQEQAQKTKFQKISQIEGTSQTAKSFGSKIRSLEQGMGQLAKQILTNRLIALSELLPLKKGKFVSSMEIGGVVGCYQDVKLVGSQTVNLRSNFITNLSLIRQHLRSSLALEGKDWLTTVLTTSNPHQNAKIYNFGSRPPVSVFLQIFRGSKRNGSYYSFPGEVHIMVDDVHLANPSTLNCLTDLSEYGFAMFLEGGIVNIYQTSRCQFTFAGKTSYPRFGKALRVAIEDNTIATIFAEYVQCYCEKYLQVDRSIFSLLNLSTSLTRLYRDQEEKYFWYKNPLLILQSAGATTLTQFIGLYLDYFIQMLPHEKTNFDSQRTLLELPRNSVDSQEQGQVINTTRKFIRFCNQTQLVQKLVADNEVLEEIQASQVESIFFDRFIKNYFTKDILDYVLLVARHLANHHLLLLAQNYPHTEKILRYACKVSGRTLLPLRNRAPPPHNAVLSIDLDHCKESELLQLQDIVKLKRNSRFDGTDVRFVLTGSVSSAKARAGFEKFPFLKSHFLSMVMWERPSEQAESLKEVQGGSSSYVGENTSGDYLEQLEQITHYNDFNDELKEEFVRILERYRKEESLNLQFYRKVSSEMMINIDVISRTLEQIPAAMIAIADRENQLANTRTSHANISQELTQKLQKWEEKRSTFSDLFNFKHQREGENLGRLNQAAGPLFSKMDKIQRKIQGIQTLEFTRLKNNLKNNQNSALVQPLHSLLAFLNQRGDALPKDKLHQFVPAAFSTPAVLASLLRSIRQREVYDKHGSQEEANMKLISTGMTSGRLKYMLGRAQEVAQSAKKFEKVSPIYKPLSSWLTYFSSICQALKDYFDQQDEFDAHLTSQLTKLNVKHDDHVDIAYQKQNLHVFITQCQNRIQEISDTLGGFGQYGKSSETELRKLSRLKRFYNERGERLQRISRLLMESQYMKKVSAGVSLYFKNVDQLSFHRALIRTTFNQCLPQRMLDPEILSGVFTARADLFHFRERLEAQSMGFEELQVIWNLVERREKRVKLVQDRDSLVKGKLVEAAQARGFVVQVFQQTSYPSILRFLQAKLTHSASILILHENIHYLEVARSDTPLFEEFLQQSISLAHQRKAEFIYVTNCLPPVPPQLYSQIQFGSVVVTRQRFMADLSDIFSVAMQKDLINKAEPKKRRSDFETVVRERNSMMKELMSSIQSLTKVLTASGEVFIQRGAEEAESEQIFSQNLQNRLGNLMTLQDEAQNIQRETTSYSYLPNSIRDLIQQELRRYLSLYILTDRTNTTTNNQFFPARQFYRQWIALLKDLREQRITWFTRMEYRSVISQIVVNKEGEERPREEGRREEEQQINQAINPVFHRNNQQVFLTLVDRLLRTTTWIQKSFLFQYALGAAVIQAFETYFHPQYVPVILEMAVNSREQVNEECLRVLKVFEEHEYFRGYEIRFDKLTAQFLMAMSGNNDPVSPGTQVVVLVHYYLLSKLNQYDTRVEDFLNRFGDSAEGKKTGVAHRYQFLRVLRNIRLSSEVMLRLTAPLSLSINLEGRGEREKIVTIIEEEKYLLGDLVELLKVKSLAKKRELECVLVDMRRRSELVETLKQHYRASKQWLLLANFSVRERDQVRQLLEEVLSQLGRLPPNPFFRIFIVLNREEEGIESLYYNKFQVNRVKACHSLSDADYFQAVNCLALQQLFESGRGRDLIQQLIVTTIRDQDDYTIAESRLQDLRALFGKMAKRHRLLKEEDLKLFYRNLVEEVGRLGFFKKEHNEPNFYQYLACYFAWTGNTAEDIRKQVQNEREFSKQGLADTQLLQNNCTEGPTEQTLTIERVSTTKIEQYFKNINSEFAEALRKEININNLIEADQQFLLGLQRSKGINKAALEQAKRVCEAKYGQAAGQDNSWVNEAARRRLPLLRLLNNLKLREICLSKKVDIQTPAEFWIFLTAFQHRQIKEFTRQLNLDRSQLQSRYSNGIGLFGNFMNTRDYATRMKMVLVDEDTYHEMPISEEEMSNVLTNNGKVEGRFVLAIRKAGPQKIVELNSEHVQVEKILRKFNVVLQIGGELTLQVAFK